MKASERHKLKHDKAAETMVSGLGWARSHQSVIIAVFVALVAIVWASVWFASSRRQATEASEQLLDQAQQLADSVIYNIEQKGEGDIDTVVGQFDRIAADNPNSPIGAQALFSAGQLFLRAKMPAKALPYMEKAMNASRKLPGLESLARRSMAEALDAMGQPEKAIEQYQKFITTPFAQEAVQAYWDIGRCYEQLKDKEKAEDFYRRAVQYGEKSKWGELASFRLSALSAGAELLGPVAATQPPTPNATTTMMAAGTTATTVIAPAPAAPVEPAVAAPAKENPSPAPAPAPKTETPQQKPDDQTQF